MTGIYTGVIISTIVPMCFVFTLLLSKQHLSNCVPWITFIPGDFNRYFPPKWFCGQKSLGNYTYYSHM